MPAIAELLPISIAAELPSASSAASALMLAGTAISTVGTIQAGNAARAAANANAESAELAAQGARIEAERKMQIRNKQTDLALSRAKAVAAAGGGSVSDPTTVKLMQDIAGEGVYNSLTELYTGQSKADAYLKQAAIERATGQQAKTSSLWRAGTTMFTGLSSSIYNKYGVEAV